MEVIDEVNSIEGNVDPQSVEDVLCNLGRYAVIGYKHSSFHHPSIELDWFVEDERYSIIEGVNL